ncbi:WD40-repeat-containing domain protein [Apiospora arundinis]
MFGCEPAPIYVFGTGVPMKPASGLQGSILQQFTGTCHLTPDYGESVSSYFFQQPLDVYSWREQTEEEAKAGIPRQLKRATFNPEATRSPFARNWSTYYGPGHAMTIALLDLSQPLQRTSEDQLVEALRRTLSWVLAPNPQMRKQLGLSVDRDRGAWIQRSESSSSTSSRSTSALLPPQIIGDTGVDIDEENLATLCMAINVEGPVTGAELRLNPLALALGYEGHVLGDDTVLSHRAVQWFTTQMMTGLARELQLGPPRFVGPDEVFPSEELGLTDVIPIPVPLPGGFDFGGFDIF